MNHHNSVWKDQFVVHSSFGPRDLLKSPSCRKLTSIASTCFSHKQPWMVKNPTISTSPQIVQKNKHHWPFPSPTIVSNYMLCSSHWLKLWETSSNRYCVRTKSKSMVHVSGTFEDLSSAIKFWRLKGLIQRKRIMI